MSRIVITHIVGPKSDLIPSCILDIILYTEWRRSHLAFAARSVLAKLSSMEESLKKFLVSLENITSLKFYRPERERERERERGGGNW